MCDGCAAAFYCVPQVKRNGGAEGGEKIEDCNRIRSSVAALLKLVVVDGWVGGVKSGLTVS